MITKARKWIMVASLMLTMCFAINNYNGSVVKTKI